MNRWVLCQKWAGSRCDIGPVMPTMRRPLGVAPCLSWFAPTRGPDVYRAQTESKSLLWAVSRMEAYEFEVMEIGIAYTLEGVNDELNISQVDNLVDFDVHPHARWKPRFF